jgi:hypothetical protein
MIRVLLECEENYLFTNDEDYVNDNLEKFVPEKKKKKEEGIERSKLAVVNQLRKRINAYFYIVTRNLKDSIPKMIGTFLVQAWSRTSSSSYSTTSQKPTHFCSG